MSNDDITKFLDELAPRRKFAPEVAKARLAEAGRRNARAQQRAYQALRRAFPEEYWALYNEARRRMYAEGGPLPGDPE